MWVEVLGFLVRQAWYDLVYRCGGTKVLLTDPRWKDPLPSCLEDYGDF